MIKKQIRRERVYMKNTNNIKIFSIIVLAGGILLFAVSLVLGAIILPLNDRSLIWNCFASYWTAPAFLFGIAFAIVGCFTLCFGKRLQSIALRLHHLMHSDCPCSVLWDFFVFSVFRLLRYRGNHQPIRASSRVASLSESSHFWRFLRL